MVATRHLKTNKLLVSSARGPNTSSATFGGISVSNVTRTLAGVLDFTVTMTSIDEITILLIVLSASQPCAAPAEVWHTKGLVGAQMQSIR